MRELYSEADNGFFSTAANIAGSTVGFLAGEAPLIGAEIAAGHAAGLLLEATRLGLVGTRSVEL